MKKIYVMAAFLGAGSLAFGQLQQASAHISKNTVKPTSTNNHFVKAVGDSIWTNDFSDGSEWTKVTTSMPDEWVIGTTPPGGDFAIAAIESTTAANGFALFDSDLMCSNDQDAYIHNTNPIDLSGHSAVNLAFQSYYRKFQGQAFVGFSTDALTWTWVEVHTGLSTNDATANPTSVSIPAIGIGGSSTAYVAFKYVGGCDYAWMVDDVEIKTAPANDLAINTHVFGSENAGTVIPFYQIPLAQTAPIKAITTVLNQGTDDQTDVVFTANETVLGDYTSTSTAISIAAGASDSLVVADDFTPNAVGNYSISYTLSADDADDVPANNVYSTYSFTVTDNLYARDTSTVAEAGTYYSWLTGANATPAVTIEPGNLYDIYNTAEVSGIDFQIGDVAPEGAEVFGQIYDANLDPVSGGETQSYIIQSGDEGKYVTLVYETPITLTPGEYVVSVKSFETNFTVATAGSSAPSTSFIYGDLGTQGIGWYYTTSTPVVRMNFDPTLSVENNELANLNVSQNFPNPFANETTVLFNLKETANVSYTVVDLTGKVVANVNEGTTMAGEHEITIDGSSFANGVYYLNIVAGDSKVTRKMIVNK